MKYFKQRDGGESLRRNLFEEAPPEKPFVRKENKPASRESGGAVQDQIDGTAAEHGTEVPLEVAQDMPVDGNPSTGPAAMNWPA